MLWPDESCDYIFRVGCPELDLSNKSVLYFPCAKFFFVWLLLDFNALAQFLWLHEVFWGDLQTHDAGHARAASFAS